MAEAKQPQVAPATPAAVFAVGGLCFGFFALLTGLVDATATPVIAGWAMVVGGTVLICGVLEMVRGEVLLGSTCLILGGLIGMGSGLAFHITMGSPPEFWGAEFAQTGYIWIAIALILLGLLPCFGKISSSLFLAIALLVAIAAILAAGLIDGVAMGEGIMYLDGVLLLIFGIYCIYASTALITHMVFGSPKLPIGGPIFK